MDDRELDNLLNAPLAPVADAGFSARVLGRITWVAMAQRATNFALVFVCLVPVLLFVPLPALSGIAAQFFAKAALSPMVAIAAAALVLTFSAERLLSRD